MRQKLLFVIDLGHFKCFRILNDETSPQPRLALIEDFDPAGPHSKMSDKITDVAGRFHGGTLNSTARGFGERHSLTSELERRTVQLLADRVIDICHQQAETPIIYLAAHKEINNQILDRLPAYLRNNVTRNLQDDLATRPHNELLHHFRTEAPVAVGAGA